ncbi:hypothetical protein [Sulfobacillus sp. hq2]|uniref:hypothetical protein n=1 Tax=Sulfobacillus sp. hq2 TaxID=2039167 RepID=UPI001304F18A|nr:hypothetical protein [Sulfobacillus sp. hq2]
MARELGIPSNTLYGGIAAYKADPVEPFVGKHLKAEDQALRLVTNDRKSSFRSFMHTVSPSPSRRGAKSSTFREAGLRRGAIALPVLQRKFGPGGSNGFGRC